MKLTFAEELDYLIERKKEDIADKRKRLSKETTEDFAHMKEHMLKVHKLNVAEAQLETLETVKYVHNICNKKNSS